MIGFGRATSEAIGKGNHHIGHVFQIDGCWDKTKAFGQGFRLRAAAQHNPPIFGQIHDLAFIADGFGNLRGFADLELGVLRRKR